MNAFDLDLRSVEESIEDDDEGDGPRVVLGVLDGTTAPREWIDEVAAGNVLVLAVDGELNRLAAGFASEVADLGGDLVTFRDILVVSPPDVQVDPSRLGRDE